jgi:tetratricopeptide (TPR) repeat protein
LAERRPKLAGPIGNLFAADNAWSRAVEIYNKGIAAETTDVDLLSGRARAYEALKNCDAAAADWSRIAAGNPEGAKLRAEFAQRLSAGDQFRLANGQFEQARSIYERSLQADPENDVVAEELAQSLLNQHGNGIAARWTVLQPTEMHSQGGATLTKLDDGSILAGGANPDKDTYTCVAQTDLPTITTFRLEALPHESFGRGGPGRMDLGNFALSEISLKAGPLSGAGEAAPVKLINPRADFEQDKYPVAASLDGNPGTAWSIDPQIGKNHAAVFEIDPSRQTGFEGGTRLTFMLDFQFGNREAGYLSPFSVPTLRRPRSSTTISRWP